jgi:hypothetical protein
VGLLKSKFIATSNLSSNSGVTHVLEWRMDKSQCTPYI